MIILMKNHTKKRLPEGPQRKMLMFIMQRSHQFDTRRMRGQRMRRNQELHKNKQEEIMKGKLEIGSIYLKRKKITIL